jgi:leucyl/phenylalanyl-tRNA---protein transferase
VPSREPAPTTWRLEPPPDDHPHDLWAVGADLEPGTLLAAYRLGLFPMPMRNRIGWFSPAQRGVVPIEPFAPSRSLRHAARSYEIRVDTAFADVVAGCARPGHPASWIDPAIVAAYERLHELGWAHSVEAWDGHGLTGGLYGVAIGGLFAAESMFYSRTDASKAAFAGLVELLRSAGDPDRRLLDVQWLTPHLRTLGAVDVTRADYRRRLAVALTLASPFERT